MARNLLKRCGLPRDFWAEAVRWSIHMLNRCPTNSIRNMTPHEAWSRHTPNVEYFQIFRCIAYAHILDVVRKKLDDKEEEKEPEPPLGISSQASPTVQDAEGVKNESGDTQFNNEHPQRSGGAPSWMKNYEVYGISKSGNTASHFSLFSNCDPISYTDTIKDPKWQQVMDEEMISIEKNDTWELTNLPENQKTISVKWVYKTKLKENGELDKFKLA
ncbi:uncharacterized protein [Solanum tuberosum]|uniref:uncharacterized protein n=1 Tax=Solanum tuberosum TaxID=4113 RepID=UPI00073A2132|nr:PREDICTED: uncharacterized protein LOC107058165 [Solanum tuberosum]